MGLVGQGTAVASARPCPEMMAMPKEHATPRAKHAPLGCAAMIGCTAPATIEPALIITPRPSIEPLAVVWPSPHSPNGRSVAPAQEPPASLL